MHILILPSWYPTYPGDFGGSFFREQALALHQHGCQVGVISPQLRSLRQWKTIFSGKRGAEEELDQGMPTYRLHGMNWYPRLPVLGRRKWLEDGLKLFEHYVQKNRKPDLLHVHSIFNAGILAYEIHKQYAIPFCITEHSSAFARGLVSDKEIKIAKDVVAQSSKNFAVSNEFSKLLTQMLSSSSPWEVMENLVNQKFLEKSIAKKTTSKFTFINVAGANENKCQSNIVDAFSRKFQKNKNVQLLIAGDGPELLRLKQRAAALGIEAQVKFPGKISRDQVLQQMSESNAFVLSSRYETFGVVVIEALALGLPVIATRCGGPETILREQDGILVPVDDIENLAQAMESVYENYDQYDPCEIRQACKARFSEEAISNRLMTAYEEVCSGRTGN